MAIREEKPISETAQETGAHPNMISNMKELELKAIVPKRCLSRPNKKHKKYPYLLKNLKITHPNHVWASDITYVSLSKGIVYYEDIYFYRYDNLKSLRKGLLKYFRFYNSVRPHQSLNGSSPDDIYYQESNLNVHKPVLTIGSTIVW